MNKEKSLKTDPKHQILLTDYGILVALFFFLVIGRIVIQIVFKDSSSRYLLPLYIPGFVFLIGVLLDAALFIAGKTVFPRNKSETIITGLLVIATAGLAVFFTLRANRIIHHGNYGQILQKELADTFPFQKKCLVLDTEGQMTRVLYYGKSPSIVENMRGEDTDLVLYDILNAVKKNQDAIDSGIPVYLLIEEEKNEKLLRYAEKYWGAVPFELLKTIHFKNREGYFYLWKDPVTWMPHPERTANASGTIEDRTDASTPRDKILWFGDELFCKDFQKVVKAASNEIASDSYWYTLARWGWRRIFVDKKGPWGDKTITVREFFQKRFSQDSFSHIIFSFGFHDLYYLDFNVIPYTRFSLEAFRNVITEIKKIYPDAKYSVVIPTIVRDEALDDETFRFQAELIGYYRNELIREIVALHDHDGIDIKIIDFEPTQPYSSKIFDTKKEQYNVISESVMDWLSTFKKQEPETP